MQLLLSLLVHVCKANPGQHTDLPKASHNTQVVSMSKKMALLTRSLLPSDGAGRRTGMYQRQQQPPMLMLMGHLQMAPSLSMAMLSQLQMVMCHQRLPSGLPWKMQRMRSELC